MTKDIQSLINEWYQLKESLSNAISKEKELRRRIFETVFQDTPGATQKNEAHGLVGKIPLYYTLDEAAYETMLPELRKQGIPDYLVKYKATLDLQVLKTIPQYKMGLLSECITMKSGLCTLEVRK